MVVVALPSLMLMLLLLLLLLLMLLWLLLLVIIPGPFHMRVNEIEWLYANGDSVRWAEPCFASPRLALAI